MKKNYPFRIGYASILFLLFNLTTLLASAQACEFYTEINSGINHTAAIKSDGSLWTWGWNVDGQLGDGTYIDKNTRTLIGTSTWQSASAGDNHTAAIKDDGTLWAWGSNADGEVGQGNILNLTINVPTQIGTATNWQHVTSGRSFSLAIKSDGTLWGWGRNFGGQLGDGTSVSKYSPTQIGTATNWESVSAGSTHTTAIQSNGSLWSWGSNSVGQLGNPLLLTGVNTPTQIGAATNWQSVSAGNSFTQAIKNNGSLWSCGFNSAGQLGIGTVPVDTLTQVGTGTDWQSVSAGSQYTLALKSDGSLWSWGFNHQGQLGIGNIVNQFVPTQIGTDTDWQSVAAAGGYHTIAIKKNGNPWAWGRNVEGQLGVGTNLGTWSPMNIVNISFYVTPLSNAGMLNFTSTVGTGTTTQTHPKNKSLSYFTNCKLIAAISNNTSDLGNTAATVTVLGAIPTYNGQPFVERWYEITPTNTSVPAEITLYFTQGDFTNYNSYATANSLPLLPVSPTDLAGIANLRITKNDNTGLGNNPIVLTPTSVIKSILHEYWAVTFNTPGFSQFRVHTSNTPLSTDLQKFAVHKEGSNAIVKWETTTEINSSHFNVLRSLDGQQFENLGRVNTKASNGNSNQLLSYNFVDVNPQIGHNYYRLEQVDMDNKTSLGKVIDIIWSQEGMELSIYPNPAKDILHINLETKYAEASIEVRLLDMSGRMIKSIQATSVDGMNQLTMSLNDIAAGAYGLQIYENNKLSHVDKVNIRD